jgi:hypothetical protein
MATKIGGGGPPIKSDPAQANEAVKGQAKESAAKETQKKQVEQKKVMDTFQRVAPQLTQKLGDMAAAKGTTGGIQFTNEHLAEVAMAFAGMLRRKPNANRRERSRMFAKALLKSRKFGRIFDEEDEQALEKVYDVIGDQLDGSPVLAQLVDEVTEGARKINLG